MNDGSDITKAFGAEVTKHLQKFDDEAQATLSRYESRLRKAEEEIQDKANERLKVIEDTVMKDFRSKLFTIVLGVVSIAAGAMLAGSFYATSDVNNSVIALQKDIIAAQSTIRASNDELASANSKMAAADAEIVKAKGGLAVAQSELSALIEDVKKTGEASKATLSSLQATADRAGQALKDMDKAKAAWERMAHDLAAAKGQPAKP